MKHSCISLDAFADSFCHVRAYERTHAQPFLLSADSLLTVSAVGPANLHIQRNGHLYVAITFSHAGAVFTPTARAAEGEAYFCALLETVHAHPLTDAYQYVYTDGNNNTWHISNTEVVYRPISRLQSSSGVYSGGEAREKLLTSAEFGTLEVLLRQALFRAEEYSEVRSMGTGSLTIRHGGKPLHTVVLPMGSPEKERLEQTLRSF